jgi:hypothetical protein
VSQGHDWLRRWTSSLLHWLMPSLNFSSFYRTQLLDLRASAFRRDAGKNHNLQTETEAVVSGHGGQRIGSRRMSLLLR